MALAGNGGQGAFLFGLLGGGAGCVHAARILFELVETPGIHLPQSLFPGHTVFQPDVRRRRIIRLSCSG